MASMDEFILNNYLGQLEPALINMAGVEKWSEEELYIARVRCRDTVRKIKTISGIDAYMNSDIDDLPDEMASEMFKLIEELNND